MGTSIRPCFSADFLESKKKRAEKGIIAGILLRDCIL